MSFELRRFLPRSLYGRAALILIVPIVTIQLVVSIVFIQRHFERVTQQMTGNIALEVEYMLRQVNAAPDLAAAQQVVAGLVAPLALRVQLPSDRIVTDTRDFVDLTGAFVIEALYQSLGKAAAAAGQALNPVLGVDLVAERGQVLLLLSSDKGPMLVTIDRGRVSTSNAHQLLVLMVVTSVLMTLIAFGFLRNQLRPIAQLARAAEAFGKGRALPYRPRGATEVRAAGAAFLDMRNRLERQIEQRTLMLSGVSHDLRTPLTRLKLGLAMLPDDDEVEALRRDVSDMEKLLDGFLAFARGDALETPQPTDAVQLAQQAVENAHRAGRNAWFEPPSPPLPHPQVLLRPEAIARALENLLNNADRHASQVVLSLSLSPKNVIFTVEDDGPGIPEDLRAEALRPFARLDPARSQNRGMSVGLGLSITADIARSHGGTLRLGQSERLGGLKAELVLAR